MGGRRDIFGIGTSFQAKRWRSLDPCGMIGVSLSFSVHLFAFFVIACYLIEGSLLANSIFLLLYTPCFILALASLYMAWSTDPGSVPMGARRTYYLEYLRFVHCCLCKQFVLSFLLALVTVKRAASGELANSGRRAIRRCQKCNENFKPNRAHHDSVTGRCVRVHKVPVG